MKWIKNIGRCKVCETKKEFVEGNHHEKLCVNPLCEEDRVYVTEGGALTQQMGKFWNDPKIQNTIEDLQDWWDRRHNN